MHERDWKDVQATYGLCPFPPEIFSDIYIWVYLWHIKWQFIEKGQQMPEVAVCLFTFALSGFVNVM